MQKTLIVGVGSVLRGDDGVGVRVIEELEGGDFPEGVELCSGDISGLDLLKVFSDYERVIIIDAADMGEMPGTIRVFTPLQIKNTPFKDGFSTHSIGLAETLTLAEGLDIECDITIIGVQPSETSYRLEMSNIIQGSIPRIIHQVRGVLGFN